jgi:hypothetical protein
MFHFLFLRLSRDTCETSSKHLYEKLSVAEYGLLLAKPQKVEVYMCLFASTLVISCILLAHEAPTDKIFFSKADVVNWHWDDNPLMHNNLS